jgi:hypothetical protein
VNNAYNSYLQKEEGWWVVQRALDICKNQNPGEIWGAGLQIDLGEKRRLQVFNVSEI